MSTPLATLTVTIQEANLTFNVTITKKVHPVHKAERKYITVTVEGESEPYCTGYFDEIAPFAQQVLLKILNSFIGEAVEPKK